VDCTGDNGVSLAHYKDKRWATIRVGTPYDVCNSARERGMKPASANTEAQRCLLFKNSQAPRPMLTIPFVQEVIKFEGILRSIVA